ncbi:MAG: antibiotic biosynthesis monooxygenase [Hyphomonas sp.]
MTSDRAGVVVEGSARVAEKDRDTYLSLVREVVAASVKRKGCLKFSVAEDISERNLFHVAELWTDMAALDASRFGEENVSMLKKFASLDVRDRKVLVYTVSSVVAG